MQLRSSKVRGALGNGGSYCKKSVPIPSTESRVLTSSEICPQLVFIPLNFDKYTGKAEEIQAILVKYDARFEAASIDEAFLNVTKVYS